MVDSATAQFETFLVNLFEEYDSTIDTSSGSAVRSAIIEPILNRLGTDPLASPVMNYILDRLQEAFPEEDIAEGSVLMDTYVKPLSIILDPFRREIWNLRQQQSFQDPSVLAPEEAQALAANFFIYAVEGDRAVGKVRMYFPAAVSHTVTQTTEFRTAGGTSFFPTSVQSISVQEMLFNRSGDLFYFDVDVEASEVGSEYNISAGDIVEVIGVPGVVKVKNLAQFVNGLDGETNEELATRVEQGFTSRSLVTQRGIRARLLDQFSGAGLIAIQEVGFGDPEMDRDVLVARMEDDLGNPVPSGWRLYLTKMPGGIIDPTDPVSGELLVPNNVVHVGSAVDIYVKPSEYTDKAQVFTNLESSWPSITTNSNVSAAYVLNDMMTIENQSFVALGSRVSSSTTTGEQATTSDYETDANGVTKVLQAAAGTFTGLTTSHYIVFQDRISAVSAVIDVGPGAGSGVQVVDDIFPDDVTVAADWSAIELSSPTPPPDTADFSASDVVPGSLLRLPSGADAGDYKVLEVGQQWLRVEGATFSHAESLDYEVLNFIVLDIVEPREVIYLGGDLVTQQGTWFVSSAQIDVDLPNGFNDAEVGDRLRIIEGPSRGNYTIEEIADNTTVKLDRQLSDSASGLRFEVASLKEGIDLPLIRSTALDLLDSASLLPEDIKIPFGQYVDIRAFDFTITGATTYGTVRIFFLDPVTFTVDSNAVFTAQDDSAFTYVLDENAIPQIGVSIIYPGTGASFAYRISATDMANNVSGELYYVDIPVKRDGFESAGDLPDDTVLELDKYVTSGFQYYIEDNTLSYSVYERVYLMIRPYALLFGVSDAVEYRGYSYSDTELKLWPVGTSSQPKDVWSLDNGGASPAPAFMSNIVVGDRIIVTDGGAPSELQNTPFTIVGVDTTDNTIRVKLTASQYQAVTSTGPYTYDIQRAPTPTLANATNLVGQSVQLSYTTSDLVDEIQSFVEAESERVLNDNPLVRHFLPSYVHLNLTYKGGVAEASMVEVLSNHISSVDPLDPLEAHDIHWVMGGSGANYVSPVTLMSLNHDVDRKITISRSTNYIDTGRTAYFIPDVIAVEQTEV